jgi:hypothetical protein
MSTLPFIGVEGYPWELPYRELQSCGMPTKFNQFKHPSMSVCITNSTEMRAAREPISYVVTG